MVFVETPIFTRLVGATLNDSDYAELQQELANHPDSGRLIEGGGGVRVIYYWRTGQAQIFLLYLFAKGAKTDLTPKQVKQLADAVKVLR